MFPIEPVRLRTSLGFTQHMLCNWCHACFLHGTRCFWITKRMARSCMQCRNFLVVREMVRTPFVFVVLRDLGVQKLDTLMISFPVTPPASIETNKNLGKTAIMDVEKVKVGSILSLLKIFLLKIYQQTFSSRNTSTDSNLGNLRFYCNRGIAPYSLNKVFNQSYFNSLHVLIWHIAHEP